MASSGTVSSYKGVRHLFSKSLTAVQSYSKLAKESIDGGRDYFRMEPFEYPLQTTVEFLLVEFLNILVQVWAKLPFTRGWTI